MMKYIEGRGTKSGNWLSNELFRSDDISFLAEADYHKMTEILCALADSLAGGRYDTVIHGLEFGTPSSLTLPVSSGVAVGFSGYYYNAGSFGFVANADGMFSVALPETKNIFFETNASGTYDRYDIVQVRPVRQVYNAKSRQFRDPATGLITSAITNTRVEHGGEVDIVKGDATQENYVPTVTPGWIKIGEVRLAAGSAVITEVLDTRSIDLWLGAITRRPQSLFAADSIRNSLVLRDDNGFIQVKTPISDLHSVNKSYVDSEVTPLVQYSILTSDSVLENGKKYVAASDGIVLSLPSSSSIGDLIEIKVKNSCYLKQTDSEHYISWEPKGRSEKGTGKFIILNPGENIKLIYRGNMAVITDVPDALTSTGYTPVTGGSAYALQVPHKHYNYVAFASPWFIRLLKAENEAFQMVAYCSRGTEVGTASSHKAIVSSDGTHIISCLSSSGTLYFFKNVNNVLTANNTLAATLINMDICSDSTLTYSVITSSSTSPYFKVIKRTGDSYADLAGLPSVSAVYSADCTPDGSVVVLGYAGSTATVKVLSRSGDTYTIQTDLTIGATISNKLVAFSQDGNYLVVGYALSPYLQIFSRSGTTFTEVATVSPTVSSPIASLFINEDGTIFGGLSGAGVVTIRRRVGSVIDNPFDVSGMIAPQGSTGPMNLASLTFIGSNLLSARYTSGTGAKSLYKIFKINGIYIEETDYDKTLPALPGTSFSEMLNFPDKSLIPIATVSDAPNFVRMQSDTLVITAGETSGLAVSQWIMYSQDGEYGIAFVGSAGSLSFQFWKKNVQGSTYEYSIIPVTTGTLVTGTVVAGELRLGPETRDFVNGDGRKIRYIAVPMTTSPYIEFHKFYVDELRVEKMTSPTLPAYSGYVRGGFVSREVFAIGQGTGTPPATGKLGLVNLRRNTYTDQSSLLSAFTVLENPFVHWISEDKVFFVINSASLSQIYPFFYTGGAFVSAGLTVSTEFDIWFKPTAPSINPFRFEGINRELILNGNNNYDLAKSFPYYPFALRDLITTAVGTCKTWVPNEDYVIDFLVGGYVRLAKVFKHKRALKGYLLEK